MLTWSPTNRYRDLGNPKNQLPARYADPALSQIKVTVKPEPNQLQPFRLTK